MKLRHGLMGLLIAPAIIGCSDDETILSVNVNLSNSNLNRRADQWEPIQVTIAQGSKVKEVSLQLPTVEAELTRFGADGLAELDAEGKPIKEKGQSVKDRFFQRVTLGSGWGGSAIVTAEAVGAYIVNEEVGGKDIPKTITNYDFKSGTAEDDLADADNVKRTIGVVLTPTPIEEEEVAAVFLNFSPPEPEPSVGGTGGTGGSGGSGGGGAGSGGGGAGGGGAGGGGAGGGSGGTTAGTGGTTAGTGGTSTEGGAPTDGGASTEGGAPTDGGATAEAGAPADAGADAG